MAQIDPESPNAPSELAVLFEEDYLTTGKDLNDPETVDNLRDTAENDLNYFMQKYDHLLQRINDELRRCGASNLLLFPLQHYGKETDQTELSDHILPWRTEDAQQIYRCGSG